VVRCTPLISRRLPCPLASSSIASEMREAPPVSTTMPSALRLSTVSVAGTCQMNHRKPPPKIITAASAANSMARASLRIIPSTSVSGAL
jgi:hypothetical protein